GHDRLAFLQLWRPRSSQRPSLRSLREIRRVQVRRSAERESRTPAPTYSRFQLVGNDGGLTNFFATRRRPARRSCAAWPIVRPRQECCLPQWKQSRIAATGKVVRARYTRSPLGDAS